MSDWLRKAAVKLVKPRVSEEIWQRLRSPAQGVLTSARSSRPAQGRVPPGQEARAESSEPTLTDLAKHFKTDKWGRHKYTPHYERHLGHLKRERFTMLEIGIGGYRREGQGGASLRMWKRYFPRAQVLGLDIADKSFVDRPRIRTYQGSQTDEGLLRRIVSEAGGLEVIIDDGSHRPEHIRASFDILFPLLADNGVYVIEDLQTSYWPRFGGSTDPHNPATTMSMIKDLLDGLNYAEFHDEDYEPSYTERHVVGVSCYHNLVFIQKGLNDEKSFGRHD